MNKTNFLKTSLLTAFLMSAPMGTAVAEGHDHHNGHNPTFSKEEQIPKDLSKAKIDETFDGLLYNDGELVNAQDFKGQKTLLFFGFAECSTICPVALPYLSSGLKKIEQEYGEDVKIKPVLITTQPLDDSVRVLNGLVEGKLRQYKGRYLHPNLIALGAMRDVTEKFSNDPKVGTALRERLEKIEAITSNFHANSHNHHNSYAYLMDETGAFMGLINPMSAYEDLKTHLKTQPTAQLDAHREP